MPSAVLLVFCIVLAVVAGAINSPDPWRGRLLCWAVACLAAADLLRGVGPVLVR